MYGDVVRLRVASQVTVNDVFLPVPAGASLMDKETALAEILTDFLETATEMVNFDRKRDFDAERRLYSRPIPAAITEATLRIAGNMVENLIDQQRSKRTARSGDGALEYAPGKLITSDVRELLNSVRVGSDLPEATWVNLMRVRSRDELMAEGLIP